MHRLVPASTTAPDRRAPTRLAPEMSSFRLLVLAFVRDYIGLMGASPSYGEIAARLGTNATRCKRAVRALVRDGHLVRIPGPRGLRLPSLRDAAVRALREQGWIIDDAALTALPPPEWLDTYRRLPVPKRTLLTTAALDYPARRAAPAGDGGETDGAGETSGAERAA